VKFILGQREGTCHMTQQDLLLHAENRILRYIGDAEFQRPHPEHAEDRELFKEPT
jgi:hypothetical protein